MSTVSENFAGFGLAEPLLRALEDVGYEAPSPIQAECLPPLLAGQDVLGQAQTGTGKTAAFALPLLHRLDLSQHTPQALILTPTRELALQVAEAIRTYSKYMSGVSVLAVYGGQGMGTQLQALRGRVHIVVGTPGRVMDHVSRGTLDLANLRQLVLDEADEMLRMGFIDDVEWLLEHMPRERQMALFSATLPDAIRSIARKHLNNPREIRIASATTTVASIRQRYWQVRDMHKQEVLTRLLEVEDVDAALVFVRTKIATSEVAEALIARGFLAAALHGDMNQHERERTVAQLKSGRLNVVVATDVAARGLDVARISHVINYDVPLDAEAYVHRIGRTGRAGRTGEAILFVFAREIRLLRHIERSTGQYVEPMAPPTLAQIAARRQERFAARVSDALAAAAKAPKESARLDYIRAQLLRLCTENDVEPMQLAALLAHMLEGDSPTFLTPDDIEEAEPQRPRQQRDAPWGDRGSRRSRDEYAEPPPWAPRSQEGRNPAERAPMSRKADVRAPAPAVEAARDTRVAPPAKPKYPAAITASIEAAMEASADDHAAEHEDPPVLPLRPRKLAQASVAEVAADAPASAPAEAALSHDAPAGDADAIHVQPMAADVVDAAAEAPHAGDAANADASAYPADSFALEAASDAAGDAGAEDRSAAEAQAADEPHHHVEANSGEPEAAAVEAADRDAGDHDANSAPDADASVAGAYDAPPPRRTELSLSTEPRAFPAPRPPRDRPAFEDGPSRDRGADRGFDRAPRERDRAPRRPADDVPMARYRIEVGREHQVEVRQIVGAIANEGGIDGKYIGRIDMSAYHSTLDLPAELPRDLLRHLAKVRVGKHILRLAPAEAGDLIERPDDSAPARVRRRFADEGIDRRAEARAERRPRPDGPPPRSYGNDSPRGFGGPPARGGYGDGPARSDGGPPRRSFDGPPARGFDGPPRRSFDGPPRGSDGPPSRGYGNASGGYGARSGDGPPRGRGADGPPRERSFDGPPRPRAYGDSPRPFTDAPRPRGPFPSRDGDSRPGFRDRAGAPRGDAPFRDDAGPRGDSPPRARADVDTRRAGPASPPPVGAARYERDVRPERRRSEWRPEMFEEGAAPARAPDSRPAGQGTFRPRPAGPAGAARPPFGSRDGAPGAAGAPTARGQGGSSYKGKSNAVKARKANDRRKGRD